MVPKKSVTAFAVSAALLCALPAVAIINGVVDTSHECVGSLHSTSLGFVCTGTLIHESWVLTSAACAASAPDLFAMGLDYATSPRVYAADYSVVHPSYDGSVFDFAVVHLATPATGEPTCAPKAPPDNLSIGTQIVTVGYGLISVPNGTTTVRHKTDNTVADLGPIQLYYETSVSGPCHGDEGGPNLKTTTNEILGVISTMDGGCSVFALSGRVSAVYDSFILATIANPPGIFFDGFESGTTSAWSGP